MKDKNKAERPEEISGNESSGKGKKRKKNSTALMVILTAIITVCLCVMAYSLYKIVSIKTQYSDAQNEYSDLQESLVTETDTDTDTDEEEVEEMSEEVSSKAKTRKAEDEKDVLLSPLEVQHEELTAINGDYTGWLYIEALPQISYPVVQGADNDYYLHRTFEGQGLFSGSIFMDYLCMKDYSGGTTVLYGHNMKDNSMFGDLYTLVEGEYTKSPYFWILTSQGNYRYHIFSMHICDQEGDEYNITNTPGTDVIDYIERCQARSMVDMGTFTYDENSRVVTLSTCLRAYGSERFVVQGILELIEDPATGEQKAPDGTVIKAASTKEIVYATEVSEEETTTEAETTEASATEAAATETVTPAAS